MEEVARITNIHSKVQEGAEDESWVVVEATAPVVWELFRPEPLVYCLKVKGRANMYTGPLSVRDGIVREVTIGVEGEWLMFLVRLEAPAEVKAELRVEKLPVRLLLRFSRSCWRNFFRGKCIVVDPGHGGTDGGHRGPVDLWEKDVVWVTAQEFKRQLERLGAKVRLTRSREENPSWAERARLGEGADLFLSLHTHGEADRRVRGAAVLYNPTFPQGELLAQAMLEEITAKTKVPGRGVFSSLELALLNGRPAFTIETVTITNWVDEGILRNPYFHRKLVLATLSSFFRFSRGISEVADHVCG
ncbi:cell wall hydrolase/autolysin [Ammonifex degensii KC4]|uniref:Cell wall hydrolase/autolysin n=1 Tax=Ammonifex degensii (strain DSM 10501 / KC4) TaxID=429009 RepID=C9RCR4_AMMDK|nr:N-acetylmuramoyl-L-alanine amidase [Ammonifex degensii]ACX52041.1 cell wall hydrolase/autolysin [Ammonifex degensii KC4]